jgi:hypothetical protein
MLFKGKVSGVDFNHLPTPKKEYIYDAKEANRLVKNWTDK